LRSFLPGLKLAKFKANKERDVLLVIKNSTEFQPLFYQVYSHWSWSQVIFLFLFESISGAKKTFVSGFNITPQIKKRDRK